MICVAISDKNVKNCLATLKNVEMAEIRLDLTEYDLNEIETVFKNHSNLVATCREGKYSNEERKEKLKKAIASGAKYVDIEVESEKEYRSELVRYAKNRNCEVIISYHNFEETPPENELKEIVDVCNSYGADIVKITTMSHGKKDNANLLELFNTDSRIVALGMGEKGKITRIIAPFLGSEFTFAATDQGEPTAPGQITYQELKKIIHIIESI